MPMRHSHHRRAMVGLLFATLFWAVSFPFVQVLYVEQRALLPNARVLFLSTLLMAARFTVAWLILLPWVIFRVREFTRLEWQQGLILALFGGVGMWLQADALAFTKASTCAFITQGYCIFLPLYHMCRHRRLPGIATVVSVIMVVIGMAWLSGVKVTDFGLGRGEWETLLAALLFTAQILCLEHPRFRQNRSVPITWIMFVGISLVSTPCAFAMASEPSQCFVAISSSAAWMIITTLAVLCSICAFVLMNRWQACVSSVEAGLIYCAEPVFTSILALFAPAWMGLWMGHSIPNERLSMSLVGGGSLITLAILNLQRQPVRVRTQLPKEDDVDRTIG